MSASAEHAFAVVDAVEAEGLRLKFEGEDAAGEKLYKCNTFFKFSIGDRVYCVKDSGTFVAICKIGAPAQEIVADKAETAETAESVGEAKIAAALQDEYSSEQVIKFKSRALDYQLMYANPRKTSPYNEVWYPLGAPRDEAVTYNNEDGIIRFRSTYDGGLEFCVPYRDKYTWKKVTTG